MVKGSGGEVDKRCKVVDGHVISTMTNTCSSSFRFLRQQAEKQNYELVLAYIIKAFTIQSSSEEEEDADSYTHFEK